MRKLINSTYISLDGAVEPMDWPSTGGPADERAGTIQLELLRSCDAVVMGRRTYEAFVPVFSAQSGDPFGDHFTAVSKYVFSSKLRDPEWSNTTVLDDDPVEVVRRMKQEPGKDIVQYGFGHMARQLMANGLLDELRLWIHPFFVGRGGPDDLIYGDVPTTIFALAEAIPLKNGIVVLRYESRS